MNESISEVRKRAWATRRKKYGKYGHAGAYKRGLAGEDAVALQRCRELIAKLHNEGILTEGQAAKATGLYRIDLRKLCDDLGGIKP